MFRLIISFSILIPLLLISLLWIECRNTFGWPDAMSLIVGVLLTVAPYVWLSVLAHLMKERPLALRLNGVAIMLIGLVAVFLLATNTSYRPVVPLDGYSNMAPPVVLFGQCMAAAIVTPILFIVFCIVPGKPLNQPNRMEHASDD